MRLRDETPLTPEAAAELAALEAALAGDAGRARARRPGRAGARAARRAPASGRRLRAHARRARRGVLSARAGRQPLARRRGDALGRRAHRAAAPLAARCRRRGVDRGRDDARAVADGVRSRGAGWRERADRGNADGDEPGGADRIRRRERRDHAGAAARQRGPAGGRRRAAVRRGPSARRSATPRRRAHRPRRWPSPAPSPVPTARSSPRQSSGQGLSAPVPTPVTPSTSRNRSVERGATLRLATTPRRLDDVASRVVRVTDGVGGFVRSSAVDSRPGSAAGRRSSCRSPCARLSDRARAPVRSWRSVRSRNESSLDVTEQVEQARDRVAGAQGRAPLAAAPARARDHLDETARLRARLRSIEARLDDARRSARQLRQRTTYSAVLVEVVTEKPREEAAGPWTPRDALGDAGRVLEVAAGVALVALAVLLPLALLALIAWPLGRAVQRRRREGALDAQRRARREPDRAADRGVWSRP